MTDEDVVRRFHAVVQCGAIHQVARRDPRHKDIWRWDTGVWADITRVLGNFLPHLGERRTAKALELLSHPALPLGHRRDMTRCLKGHLFTPENTYVWKDSKACRTCITARGKARRERLKLEA